MGTDTVRVLVVTAVKALKAKFKEITGEAFDAWGKAPHVPVSCWLTLQPLSTVQSVGCPLRCTLTDPQTV
jgi:hypothetical protein